MPEPVKVDRFNLTITAETKTTDGKPFNKNTIEYFDMSEASLVVIEKVMAGVVEELVKLGELKAIPPIKKA